MLQLPPAGNQPWTRSRCGCSPAQSQAKTGAGSSNSSSPYLSLHLGVFDASSNIPNTFCPLGSSEASEPSKSTGLLHLAPSGATLLPLPPAVIAACLELRPPSNMPVTTSKLNFSTEAFAAMILQDKGNPSSVQQRPQLPPVSVARATINKSQNHKN